MAIEILLRTLREVKPDIRVAEIADFPGYAVDSDGDVWSFKQRNEWRKLSPHLDRHGYPTATLDYKARGVHTLVLRAFVGPCPPGHEASHFPDPTRTNNKLSNLRWEPRAKNKEQYEVAWEYLRLVDESPVDEAWLRSVGFTDDRAGCPTLGPLHIQSQPFQRPGRNTEYPAYACIRSLPIPIPKTRQDVRELCRLLGIPLQETTV